MSWMNNFLFAVFWYPVEFAFYIVAICYMVDRLGWYNFKLKVVKKDVPASFNGTLGEAGNFFKNMNSMYKQVTSSLSEETAELTEATNAANVAKAGSKPKTAPKK